MKAVDLSLGTLYFETNQFKDAIKSLDRFLTRSPNHVKGFIPRARVLKSMGDKRPAVNDFDRALALSKQPRPEYFIERAQLIASLGPEQADEALQGLEEGMTQLGPIVALILAAIAIETESKYYDSALERLDKIISQSQRKDLWIFKRGEILEKAGRADEARETFQEALDLIEALSPTRRSVRSTVKLEDKLRNKIESLTLAQIGDHHDIE